ncbi:hypothetical protein NAMH_0932 [Nautilia profundicola AmH]|uniref:Uncharacterized protein n=1 Tax=Nautilia profundicola (strain ATCC BAA-1463 / DSM 18972 / AmH) TaxID=598659 RepID=B9L9M6_NAUPA|nr:DUF4282 domain-containing protein [Nautilia profundicola]ACM92161.1 hypothetical protein NAMH_0932 [Nautilia profundicola AmH]
MNNINDFLTFKKFISTDVLIFFYYFFALLIPLFLIYGKNKILSSKIFKSVFPNYSPAIHKTKMIIFMLVCFLLFELFLRMFFEFLIAYLQIRDALVQ